MRQLAVAEHGWALPLADSSVLSAPELLTPRLSLHPMQRQEEYVTVYACWCVVAMPTASLSWHEVCVLVLLLVRCELWENDGLNASPGPNLFAPIHICVLGNISGLINSTRSGADVSGCAPGAEWALRPCLLFRVLLSVLAQ